MSADRFRAGTPVLVFLLLALAIAGVGYFVFQQQAKNLKARAQNELAAIADLKADQIARWRSERKGNAQSMSRRSFLEPAVTQWFAEGAPPGERRQRILDRLTTLQKAYDYQDVILLDGQGVLRLSTSGAPMVSPAARGLAAEAIRTGTILFSDLYRAEEEAGQPIRLDLFAPLIDRNGRVAAVLLFRIAPDRFLFPHIQSWPTPSVTAETQLVERAGHDVLFLNELRHRKNTALSMRFPISDENLPAAMAARGQEGLIEGIDYRGIPVLAGVRKIADSPWALIAKVDQQEVYAPVLERALLIAGSIFALIALAGLLILLWWRQQRSRFLLRESQDRLERQALLQHFDYLSGSSGESVGKK